MTRGPAEPGASNTRCNTPTGTRADGRSARKMASAPASAGRLSPPKAAPRVRVLCTRLDAWVIAYQGTLSGPIRTLLDERRAEALALKTGVAVDLGGYSFELGHSRKSREGWWKLSNEDVDVIIDTDPHVRPNDGSGDVAPEQAEAGWSLAFEWRAKFLATRGHTAATALSRELADVLLDVVQGERLRRADLCADVAGLHLESIDAKGWLKPRRTKLADHRMLADYRRKERTGFVIGEGKGGIMLRMYDKREELSIKRDDEKQKIEEELWTEAGWDGEEPITRVELELRGDALKEFDDGALRDPDRFIARMDAVWAYGTRKWARLVQRDTAPRLERCVSDRAWQVVQNAVFQQASNDVVARVRHRGTSKLRTAWAYDISAAAGTGVIAPISHTGKNARAHFSERSEEFCEAYVRDRVFLLLCGTFATQVADAILEHFDSPRDAAAFVVEQNNAACARKSRCDELGPPTARRQAA